MVNEKNVKGFIRLGDLSDDDLEMIRQGLTKETLIRLGDISDLELEKNRKCK